MTSPALWTTQAAPSPTRIWEITPGTVADVEADELFVVLSGSATIAFEDAARPGGRAGRRRQAAPEGARTVWTVHETLRKVYAIVS